MGDDCLNSNIDTEKRKTNRDRPRCATRHNRPYCPLGSSKRNVGPDGIKKKLGIFVRGVCTTRHRDKNNSLRLQKDEDSGGHREEDVDYYGGPPWHSTCKRIIKNNK